MSEQVVDIDQQPWDRQTFEARLRALGRRYHIHHPYQVRMNRGEMNRLQVQRWVANRYYYQINIPLKDAALMARCPDREVRRQWVLRILDHDGQGDDPGGIEAWLRLGEACGLARDEIIDQRHVLPGVRFAVDAYVNFVRQAPWEEGVCSSLTELFAPEIHRERLKSWPEHYTWIEPQGLQYFRKRLSEARRDVEHGLDFVLDHFRTRPQQMRALEILQFKLDVLWSMLDAMYLAYVLDMPPYFSVEKAE
jgi:pyrroloquinoline-quinone synthase